VSRVTSSRTTWRLLMKTAGALHSAIYRLSRGRIAGRIGGLDVLLLTTTGRHSGRRRTTPLLFVRDGSALVVIASNGGRDWPPAWSLNLAAHPDAEAEIRGRSYPVRARVTEGEERERLWALAVEGYGGYAGYAARTTRLIPVVALEPRVAA
jgi:F420H(2)-dependent quinone reductase